MLLHIVGLIMQEVYCKRSTTEAIAFSGGDITIQASDIRLRGNSDIETDVEEGDRGGNITLTANSILAFDDSDILAFAPNGQGGNITLNTSAFFGENFTLASLNQDPDTLDGNDRVDINATGAFSGTVTIPDTNFIQNSLNNLPSGVINTETLIANSCVVRNEDGSSTFVITGRGGLQPKPGDDSIPTYSTGDVQPIPSAPNTGSSSHHDSSHHDSSSTDSPWQIGDPIIEPQGVYQLPNEALIMTHECR